jgi:hypothetical protein
MVLLQVLLVVDVAAMGVIAAAVIIRGSGRGSGRGDRRA